MRVVTIVNRVLGKWRDKIHAKRLTAMLAVIVGIVRAERLSLSPVGRALASRAKPKHGIKRVDRLLSNGAFHRDRWSNFAAVADYLVAGERRPVIVVDWTKVVGDFHALYAAIPVGGRAQPVYFEVHPERRTETRAVHDRFLQGLRDILPPGCRPIIVTDAGFHGPLFREVLRLGWDFVGRLRGRTTMRPHAAPLQWTCVRGLYLQATTIATDLGLFGLYKKVASLRARLVLIHRKRKGNHRWRRRLSVDHTSTMTGGKEPWLLATSLKEAPAAEIVRCYGTRMQIEEFFRDTKNHRFGWSLRHVRCSSRTRLESLLVLSMLAMLAVTLVGMAVEGAGLHRQFQANTVKTRVLSHFYLGLVYLSAFFPPPITVPKRFSGASALGKCAFFVGIS
jgi:hypothetical protein